MLIPQKFVQTKPNEGEPQTNEEEDDIENFLNQGIFSHLTFQFAS